MNGRFRIAARWSSAALLGIALSATLIVVSTLDDDVPPRWLAANGLYQSLQNIEQDAHFARSVVVKSPDQYVYVRVTNGFSIAPLEPAQALAGTAVISETRGGVTRSVRYARGPDRRLQITYRVDGRVRTLDAEGERWLESMLRVSAPAFSRS